MLHYSQQMLQLVKDAPKIKNKSRVTFMMF